MPKTETPETTATADTPAVTPPAPPSLGELESAYESAMLALKSASDNVLVVAQGGGDLPAIEAAVVAKKTAEAACNKAETAFKNAKLLAENAGRINAGVDAKNLLAHFVMDDAGKAIVDAFAAGIVGLHITADSDGVLHVTVNDGVTKAMARAPRAATGEPTRRGKKRWSYNGEEFTSRELLIAHGGDEGAEAVNRYDNWQTLGLKSNPGFDSAVVKLAATLGAVDLNKA